MAVDTIPLFPRPSPTEPWRAEVVVVGSGPGGAVTACALAEAGREVLLVEEGPYLAPDACAAFSLDEMTRKYRAGGLTVTFGGARVAYVEGRCVGGGSEVNSGLYHRVPPDVLNVWRREFQIEAMTEADLAPHHRACEADLSVSRVPGGRAPLASRKLLEGARAMGWRAIETPRCFRYDPGLPGSVPTGTKQSMTRTYIPRALRAGCRLLSQTRVQRLRQRRGRWQLQARHQPPFGPGYPITIETEQVFLACGAVQTPTLLRRSGIRTHVGDTLQLHPTVKVVALFDEDVSDRAMPVPVHQVKEFAPRLTFGCSISTPPHLALALLDHPNEAAHTAPHRAAVYYAMLAGTGNGSVRPLPFFRDPLVRYSLTSADRIDLAEGLKYLCRLLLQVGATRLLPAFPGAPVLHSEADLARLPASLGTDVPLMTIHLFSTCPMGEDRQRCVADSFGRVHGTAGLSLADASLLPTSPSVNPQGAIMAIARRNVRHFLKLD